MDESDDYPLKKKRKKEILCSSWIWPRLRWVVAFPYVFMNVFGYAKRFLDDAFYVAAHLASFIPKREHNQPSSCCLILFSSYSFFFCTCESLLIASCNVKRCAGSLNRARAFVPLWRCVRAPLLFLWSLYSTQVCLSFGSICRSPSSSREARTVRQNGPTKRQSTLFRPLLSTEVSGVALCRLAVAASHLRLWNTWYRSGLSTRNPVVTSRFTLAIWALRWSFAKSVATWRSPLNCRAISQNREPVAKVCSSASKDAQLRSALTSPPYCWAADKAGIRACHLADAFTDHRRTSRRRRWSKACTVTPPWLSAASTIWPITTWTRACSIWWPRATQVSRWPLAGLSPITFHCCQTQLIDWLIEPGLSAIRALHRRRQLPKAACLLLRRVPSDRLCFLEMHTAQAGRPA